MPRRPQAPGARKAQRELERLILARQRKTLALARKQVARDSHATDQISFALAALSALLGSIFDLTPAEEKAIASISRLILAAGIRSARRRSKALSADPRLWGADEKTLIQRALESQRETVTKSYIEAGVWFAEDLAQKLAEAQALGTAPSDVSQLMRDRFGVAKTYADRTAIQVTRAGVEQGARARMDAAGVVEFTWRAVDRFARPLHLLLNGQRYSIETGHPTEGFPGEPWGCRCFQDPVIPEALIEAQALPGAAFQPSAGPPRTDPRGLPLLARFTPPSLRPGRTLEDLLSEMVTFGP